MDLICQEIGINIQHVCETSVPGRYQLICDKQWLKYLEQRHKIGTFTSYAKLDKRAHPTGVLEHPWTRILIQTYQKYPQIKAFPLPRQSVDISADDVAIRNDDFYPMPLTYSQALSYVTNTNFKNLWEAAYKRYQGAHIKFCKSTSAPKAQNSPRCDVCSYDVVLNELIQRVFNCPVIHCKLDRLQECGEANDVNDILKGSECHPNVLPALIAIETSKHISVFFYPPAIVTTLHDCISYSPSILSKSYNKPLFFIYQLFQLSKALQSKGLFLGDVRLHDILLNDNLWLQVIPRIEANILRQNNDEIVHAAISPSDIACVGAESELNAAVDGDRCDGVVDHVCDTTDCNADIDTDDVDAEDSENSSSTKFDLKFAYDLEQFSLREYCEMWCNGQLSNYDYLTILNNATGRSLNNPAYHHIMPWVTDFTARNGANWRDLSKSKYRLNKGDIHLDLMFSHATYNQIAFPGARDGHSHMHGGNHLPVQDVPHHVSDFLSEITFFVYMARRTPQHILCEHVRPIWVPAEYPVSIQRLQEWTPDECIPQFYSDPMIFKSIHEDLPDLELPTWATCPEDFICKHREALESQYVSERLQHWIDLNFGYKLTGKAAIKSKNVCLSMVDQHKNLCRHGIVQLFTHPHPPKRFPSPWFNKTAPRISLLGSRRSPKSTRVMSNEPKPLAKSTENLHTANTTDEHTLPSTSSTRSVVGTSAAHISSRAQEELVPSANFYHTTNFIELPKDYNPCSILQSLETIKSFFARTFLKQKPLMNAKEKMVNSDLMFDLNSAEHSFTNQLFADGTPDSTITQAPIHCNHLHNMHRKTKNLLAPSANFLKRRTLKNMISEKRERELQTMGCLIVELFAMQRLRPLLMNGTNASFEERLQACRSVAELNHRQDIPKCLRYIMRLLLQLQLQSTEIVTEHGLPAPTATQILEPIFSNILVPFPNTYHATYALIRALQAFNFNATLLELHTHFHCNGKDCAKYTAMDRKRVLFERKLAECKVMSCCAHIGRLLEPVAYEQFTSIELLLPHIIDLLTNEQTSILSAWNLFDPFAQALGIVNTQKHLLLPIMKLYDVESFERGMTSVRTRTTDAAGTAAADQLRFSTSSSFKSRKSVKLYHHSFLLRLIVRFGLRCFLQNFITPLIEAVGGYKEPDVGNGLHYHNTTGSEERRLSKHLNLAAASTTAIDIDDENTSMTLMSPDLLETDADDATLSADVSTVSQQKQEIEDVFTFEDDVNNADQISNSGTAENKSVDSFDISRPAAAEEAKEDYPQHTDMASAEKLAISELIYGAKIGHNSCSSSSIDDVDKLSLNSQTNVTEESPTQLHGPKSPIIAIPSPVNAIFRRAYQLSTIDCEIGSRKSVDSFEILTQAAEEEQLQQQQQKEELVDGTKNAKSSTTTPTQQDPQQRLLEEEQSSADSLQACVISKMSQAKSQQNNRISEMSAESLVWLSHRLGPVLTSRYITRNLLKMLSLCYVGQENLLPENSSIDLAVDACNLNYFTIADALVVGDRSAARVLECLMSIAALFGEEVILLQYFPHVSELITLSTKRLTGSLEGAIISTLQLLKYMIPCLMDATIMEHLKDIILDNIILPLLRLLASTQQMMPSGYLGRSVLARKLLDAIYALCVRIGPAMSKDHLCMPALRPFFLIFDKAYGVFNNFDMSGDNSASTISPPKPINTLDNSITLQQQRIIEEIRDVFTPALAHTAYLAFLRFLGESIMQRTLVNLEFILTLCHEFEQPPYNDKNAVETNVTEVHNVARTTKSSDAIDCPIGTRITLLPDEQTVAANSFGTQLIGNRIEVASGTSAQVKQEIGSMEVLDMVAYKFEHIPTIRHLKGNWLAYWRHEISRPDKDLSTLNIKQIRLQSFIGHTNSVRSLLALDNENSFISASKDKTVKLWSLRSEGDGKKVTSCQFTYTTHKKSIHSLAFLEAMRFVVSCDGDVHIWDPFIGRPLGILDSTMRYNPCTVVKTLPSPSPLIVAGTAESSVKMIDSRCMQFVNEWRVNPITQSSGATVRCIAVAPSGNWLAVGLSSGSIVMLDTRTGTILNAWRPMECDLLQLAAPNDQQLVSSALDHSLAVWHANDGILHYQLKPPAEPAHFLQCINSELIFATTGNRIGVYSDVVSAHANYSVTKLRSETFRGVLTSCAVLPLNRAFLAGNESGNIVLLC